MICHPCLEHHGDRDDLRTRGDGCRSTQVHPSGTYIADACGIRPALNKDMPTRRCPHCGNINPKFLQSNGESSASPDLTLLCVRPVATTEWSFTENPLPEDLDEDGRVPCGMQWDANQEAA